MSKTHFMARQGDVLIREVAEIPATAAPVEPEHGRVVLAHGEATGHHHSLLWGRAAMFRDDAIGRTFLGVSPGEPVALVHQEHDPINIPPGTFEVIRQVEFDLSEGVRQVAD
ncbi:MAG: hypothetical protein AB7I42_26485 [Bradyrhizobium sp.]|uniref:hypothetical protein n=1 Tax=Bradyrhizobium sp. TaxID=376 RepID=UPI003D0F2192